MQSKQEFRKVFVRGCCVNFSPEIINEYLGRNKSAYSDYVPSFEKIAREINTRQVTQWKINV